MSEMVWCIVMPMPVQSQNKVVCLVDPSIQLNDRQKTCLSLYFHVCFWEKDVRDFAFLEQVHGLLIQTKLPDSVIEQCKQLKFVGVRAKNTDYINSSLLQEKNIALINIPSMGNVAVAEHAMALVLAIAKQLSCAHQNVQSGEWRKGLVPNMQLSGKRMGIIGYGKIGQEVERLAQAFQMNVTILSSNHHQDDLVSLLQQSDIITLHLSTGPKTHHFINAETLSYMKSTSIIINTSRGSVVDYKSLYAALRSRQIAGAGLDVFEEEPLHNTAIAQLPNVICTSHIGFMTEETLERMSEALVSEVIRHFLDPQ